MNLTSSTVAIHPFVRQCQESLLQGRTNPCHLPFIERVLESSACALVVVDATQVVRPIAYASPAFLSLVGYAMAELSGFPWAALAAPAGYETLPSSAAADFLTSCTRGTLHLKHRNQTPLCFDAQVTHLYSEGGTLTHYIVVLHDGMAEQQAREALQYRANHDPLTGLANRYVLRERFDHDAARALRRDETFSLLILDLNGFKAVNDTFGHEVGDAVLQEVGRRLKTAVREEDTVVRLGGDEFVVLLSDVEVADTSQSIVDRISESLREPTTVPGCNRVAISCSSGVARFPYDGTTLDSLLRVADARLYRKKRSLRSRLPRSWSELHQSLVW